MISGWAILLGSRYTPMFRDWWEQSWSTRGGSLNRPPLNHFPPFISNHLPPVLRNLSDHPFILHPLALRLDLSSSTSFWFLVPPATSTTFAPIWPLGWSQRFDNAINELLRSWGCWFLVVSEGCWWLRMAAVVTIVILMLNDG